eukprot:Pgem_evm1s16278
MVELKNLPEDVADKIGELVKLSEIGQLNFDLIKSLTQTIGQNKMAKKGLDELALLMKYLDCFGCLDRVSFDMSLARGLDYYTGVIYETVFIGE